MALEEVLLRNNELIEKQNLLLEKLLSNAGGAPAESKAATTKPAASKTDTKADTKADTKTDAADGPSYEDVKKAASAWLAEHPKGSDEQAARRAYLETELWPKLGIKKLGDLEGKPADLAKVAKWLDTKAKTDLLGYGAGIFAKPAEEGSSDEGGEDEL